MDQTDDFTYSHRRWECILKQKNKLVQRIRTHEAEIVSNFNHKNAREGQRYVPNHVDPYNDPEADSRPFQTCNLIRKVFWKIKSEPTGNKSTKEIKICMGTNYP